MLAFIERLFGVERTRVDLRNMKTPASRWSSTVRYDIWGTPYARGFFVTGPYWCWPITLHADGRTSATWDDGTEWRHKSGPPVRFTPKPKTLFPDEKANG